MVLLESITLCMAGLALVLFACEIGQQFTNAFSDEASEALGQLNFYLLPIEIQQMLPMMIVFSHQPFVVHFFGSLCCTRDQFKKVSAHRNNKKTLD